MAKIRRSFSAELKAKDVLELLAGSATQAELTRRHQVKPQLFTSWKKPFLERTPTLFVATEPGESQQAKRVAELEQLVGRQALELEVLKKPHAG